MIRFKFQIIIAFILFSFSINCLEEYKEKEFELWEKKSSLQEPRYDTASVLYNSTDFYVLNGQYQFEDGDTPQLFNKIDIYDAINNRWKKAQNLNRGLAAAFAYENSGYIFFGGGYYYNAEERLNKANDQIFKFDPLLNTWDYSLPNMPTGEEKSYASCIVYRDKLFVIGGASIDFSENKYNYQVSKTIIVYNTYTDTWEEFPSMTKERALSEVIEWHGKIYVIGGGNRWPGKSLAALSSIEGIDPALRTVELLNSSYDMPEGKMNFATVKAIGKNGPELYAFGGSTNTTAAGDRSNKLVSSNKTLILNLTTLQWTEDARYQLDKNTKSFVTFLVNETLYMYAQPGEIYKFKLKFPIDYEEY